MSDCASDFPTLHLKKIFDKKKLAKFGYLLAESELGVMIYHPESLFFIRVTSRKAELGYTIKRMTYIKNLPNDLWRVQAISCCEIKNEKSITDFINSAFIDYEDYAFQIPLTYKVKKVFKGSKVEITSQKNEGYYSETRLLFDNFEVFIFRDYWTQRLNAQIKFKESAQPLPIEEFAKVLKIEKPISGLISSKQKNYLEFLKVILFKLSNLDKGKLKGHY